jgi:hypothetical protein
VLMAGCLLLGILGWQASNASASETPFCGGQTVAPNNVCVGAARAFNALYGTGNLAAVCVQPSLTANGSYPIAYQGCAPAGQGVYVPEGSFYMETITYPLIRNIGGQNTQVWGISFRP